MIIYLIYFDRNNNLINIIIFKEKYIQKDTRFFFDCLISN